MIPFAIVGTGWRSHFFLRIARACPDRFTVTAVVSRNPQKAQALNDQYGVQLVPSLDDAISTNPLFIVTSVPRAVNPGLLHTLADRDIPALSETPPGTTVEDLTALSDRLKQGAKIQVAEQYFLQPHHAARLAFAHSGKLGRISQAQISAAHGYHGLSLVRKFLGISFENPTIIATTFTSPLVKGPNRTGPPEEEALADSTQRIAWLDFGDRLGVFDFASDQYFSPIRNQRLLIRG
ncbi:MAG: Gfo/Idh/MocA family oxidoreductase, partial [bacterium]|nr:Gfo/Idh/MocA family oxidoreductase [bacterium]